MDKENNENRVIEFKTINNFKSGQILELLRRSNAGLIEYYMLIEENLR
jgi:hypothetical protein